MAQTEEFQQRGYVRIPAAFDPAAIAAVRDLVWSFLEAERGVRRDDPATWRIPAPWAGLKALKSEPVFRALRSPALESAIDQILEPDRWERPPHWGGFLVSFPDCSAVDWRLPAAGWHVDFHFTHEPGSDFGIRAFTFLNEVQPRGGGTLVVRGSHRIVEEFVSRMTPEERAGGYRRLLARFNAHDSWFTELTSGDAEDERRIERFMRRPRVVDGVPLQVDQLTGSPGDVVLSHPWILHTVAPNSAATPRFMIGKVLYTQSAAAGVS